MVVFCIGSSRNLCFGRRAAEDRTPARRYRDKTRSRFDPLLPFLAPGGVPGKEQNDGINVSKMLWITFRLTIYMKGRPGDSRQRGSGRVLHWRDDAC